MAAMQGGQVTWILDADSSKLNAGLNSAKRDVKDFAKEADAAGNSAAKSLSNSSSIAGSALQGLGKIAASTGKAIAVGIGAAATVAVGAMTALGVKGISSANDLQSLQLSMNGLTKSMDQGRLAMAGAYEYAQRAPFQLPDVAATTKTLIAYGMSAKGAVDSLESLGNVSITTGVPLQSLGSIFGRVSAQGKLMLGDIRQLTDNGVAILPALQQQLGKTAQEVEDMATAGQISFADFQKAMSSMVDPTILEQMQNTLPRQVDRLKGSIRQLSNAFVGVGVDATNGFTMASNGITQAVTTLTKTVADQLRTPEIKAAAASIGNSLVPAISSVTQMIAPLISTITSISGPIATLAGSIGQGIVSLLQGALPGLQVFFTALGQAFVTLGPAIQQVGAILGQSLGTVLTALAPAIQPLAQALAIIAPVIAEIVGLVAQFAAELLTALAPILPPIAKALADIAKPLIDGLRPILPMIVQLASALAQAFIQILQAIMPIIPPLMQLAMQILQQILMPIMPLIIQLIQLFAQVITMVLNALMPLLPPIMQLVQTLIANLAPILPMIITLFIKLVQAFLPLLPPLLQLITVLLPPLISLITFVANVFSILSNIILSVVVGAIQFVITQFAVLNGWIGQVMTFVGNLWQKFSDAFTKIMMIVNQKIQGIVDWFRQLPGKVMSAISGLGNSLFNAGRDALQGFLNGIGNMANAIYNKVKEIAGNVMKSIKSALGIKSPSKVMMGYGQDTALGFALGIDKGLSNIDVAATQMASASIAPTVTASELTGPTNNSNVTNNINGNIMLQDQTAVNEFFNKLNRNNELAQKGMALT